MITVNANDANWDIGWSASTYGPPQKWPYSEPVRVKVKRGMIVVCRVSDVPPQHRRITAWLLAMEDGTRYSLLPSSDTIATGGDYYYMDPKGDGAKGDPWIAIPAADWEEIQNAATNPEWGEVSP